MVVKFVDSIYDLSAHLSMERLKVMVLRLLKKMRCLLFQALVLGAASSCIQELTSGRRCAGCRGTLGGTSAVAVCSRLVLAS